MENTKLIQMIKNSGLADSELEELLQGSKAFEMDKAYKHKAWKFHKLRVVKERRIKDEFNNFLDWFTQSINEKRFRNYGV